MRLAVGVRSADSADRILRPSISKLNFQPSAFMLRAPYRESLYAMGAASAITDCELMRIGNILGKQWDEEFAGSF